MSEGTRRLIVYVGTEVHEAVSSMALKDGRKVSNYVAQLLKREAISEGYIEVGSEGSTRPQERSGASIDKVTTPPLKTLSKSVEAVEDSPKATVVEVGDEWC